MSSWRRCLLSQWQAYVRRSISAGPESVATAGAFTVRGLSVVVVLVWVFAHSFFVWTAAGVHADVRNAGAAVKFRSEALLELPLGVTDASERCSALMFQLAKVNLEQRAQTILPAYARLGTVHLGQYEPSSTCRWISAASVRHHRQLMSRRGFTAVCLINNTVKLDSTVSKKKEKTCLCWRRCVDFPKCRSASCTQRQCTRRLSADCLVEVLMTAVIFFILGWITGKNCSANWDHSAHCEGDCFHWEETSADFGEKVEWEEWLEHPQPSVCVSNADVQWWASTAQKVV